MIIYHYPREYSARRWKIIGGTRTNRNERCLDNTFNSRTYGTRKFVLNLRLIIFAVNVEAFSLFYNSSRTPCHNNVLIFNSLSP